MPIETHLTAAGRVVPQQLLLRDGLPGLTNMSGNVTLTRKSAQVLKLNPNGAARTVTLPQVDGDVDGLWFLVIHTGVVDGETITVSDGGTVATLSRGEVAAVWCDGSDWHSHAPLTSASFIDTGGLPITLTAAGVGTGSTALRVGGSGTEGLELRVYEQTVSPSTITTNLINFPAGSVPVSVQSNVETALTGGGTTVTYSIGIAGDIDKYGTPASDSLTQNTKSDAVADWAVLAAAEQLVLTAAASGGATAGDTALTVGSVRVRVVYYALNSLDDA